MPNALPSRCPLHANSVAVTRIFGPPTEWPGAQIWGGHAQQVEIQSCTVGNPNTAHPATPWVELELNSLGASEKAIGYGNKVQRVQTCFPYSCSDKPVPMHAGRARLENWPIREFLKTPKFFDTAVVHRSIP